MRYRADKPIADLIGTLQKAWVPPPSTFLAAGTMSPLFGEAHPNCDPGAQHS